SSDGYEFSERNCPVGIPWANSRIRVSLLEGPNDRIRCCGWARVTVERAAIFVPAVRPQEPLRKHLPECGEGRVSCASLERHVRDPCPCARCAPLLLKRIGSPALCGVLRFRTPDGAADRAPRPACGPSTRQRERAHE